MSREAPVTVANPGILTQIGQRNNVTRVGVVTRLIGHPHLHTVDLHARQHVGQLRHRLVVVLTEVVGEEEVTVLLVVGGIHLEGRCLSTALCRYALRRRLLLREHCLELQLAELHVGPDTEEAGSASHQRVVRGEAHVTTFHQLDDFIFLAVVLQLQVLGIEIERGVSVVVQVHIHLVAHLTVHAEVDLLVEVERRGLTVADGQRGVVDALDVHAQLQFGRSLCFDTHATRTEDLLCRPQVEVHVGKRELVFTLRLHVLHILLAEEVAQGPLLRPFRIFLRGHQQGGVQIVVTHLCTHIIHIGRVIILHRLTDILRIFQVDGDRVEVTHLHRGGLLSAPTRA